MRAFFQRWLYALIFLHLHTLAAGEVHITDIHLSTLTTNTQLQLNFSGPYRYKAFLLSNPNRLVIDLPQAQFNVDTHNIHWQKFAIQRLRFSHQQNNLRMVFDLAAPVQFKTRIDGLRLVVQLMPTEARDGIVELEQRSQTKTSMLLATAPTAPPVKTVIAPIKTTTESPKTFIIALDPGHGGADSGAQGPGGTLEKNVTLAVARALATLINQQKNMRVIFTREGDYYVGLRQRMLIARKNKADLFISIHADSFRDPTAAGASVFTLSEHGASSEAARWLAMRENRTDLIGGVSLDTKDPDLASVLLNLSQTANNQASFNLGSAILQKLNMIVKLHKNEVQQAGFMVLKSPDIPSVLVETGFISNPLGEQKLQSGQHQQQLAQAMLQGIRTYVDKHPQHSPNQSTLLASTP